MPSTYFRNDSKSSRVVICRTTGSAKASLSAMHFLLIGSNASTPMLEKMTGTLYSCANSRVLMVRR